MSGHHALAPTPGPVISEERMATNSARIVVAQGAHVYIAPTGTSAPASEVASPASAWVEVGLFTPDSLSFTSDPTFAEVNSHQSNYPTRRMQETDSATISVDLQEWSGANFQTVYGGGTLTTVTAGHFKFAPPAIGARSEVSVLVDIQDGSKHYRYVIPRALQVEGVTQELQRGQEARLPLSLAVLGGDTGDPWYLLTDDTAFTPAP
jgi:hypothetical protein